MKNKKGFTLVEIIVTIALLTVIGIIIAVNFVSLSKKQEEKEKTRIESIIKSAAEAYIDVEKKDVTSACVKVDTLINDGYLKKSDVKNYQSKYVNVIINESEKTKTYEIVDEESECNSTPRIFTLTYDANAEDVTNLPEKVEEYANTTIVINDQVPLKNGYKFKGWSESKTGSVKYKAGDNYKITGNKTLYAVWAINSYIVEYDTQGKADIDSQELDYNSTITLPKVTANDSCYGLNEWIEESTGRSYAGEEKYTILSDTKFKALWGVATYSLNYFKNTEDEVTNIPLSQTVECGDEDTLVSNLVPQRTGYTFKGWSTSKKGSINYKPGDNINVSTTINLYALWEANTYTITLDKNEGSGGIDYIYEKYNTGMYKDKDLTISLSSLDASSLPTRDNYIFQGYYSEGKRYISSKGEFEDILTSTSFTKDITLYARWEPKTYTISLNKVGGTGGSSYIYESYNTGLYSTRRLSSLISKINIPAKEKYNFGGYYSSMNGRGIQYIDSSGNIKFTSTTFKENTTLYAKWNPLVTVTAINATPSVTSTYVDYNGNLNISFTRANNYKVDTVICDGIDFNSSFEKDILTLKNIKTPTSCEVKYKKINTVLTLKVPAFFTYNINDTIQGDDHVGLKEYAIDEFSYNINENDHNFIDINIPVNDNEKILIPVEGSMFGLNNDSEKKVYSFYDLKDTEETYLGYKLKIKKGESSDSISCKYFEIQDPEDEYDVYGNKAKDFSHISIDLTDYDSTEELTCDLSDVNVGYVIGVERSLSVETDILENSKNVTNILKLNSNNYLAIIPYNNIKNNVTSSYGFKRFFSGSNSPFLARNSTNSNGIFTTEVINDSDNNGVNDDIRYFNVSMSKFPNNNYSIIENEDYISMKYTNNSDDFNNMLIETMFNNIAHSELLFNNIIKTPGDYLSITPEQRYDIWFSYSAIQRYYGSPSSGNACSNISATKVNNWCVLTLYPSNETQNLSVYASYAAASGTETTINIDGLDSTISISNHPVTSRWDTWEHKIVISPATYPFYSKEIIVKDSESSAPSIEDTDDWLTPCDDPNNCDVGHS